MPKKALNYLVLPSRPIAAGAATPNPGIVGVSIWSSTEIAELIWDGTSWQLSGAGLSATTPLTLVSTTSAAGTASTAAKTDHTHAHGIQSGTSLHELASGSSAGFISSTDFTKLASIAANASVLAITVSTTPSDLSTAAIGTSTEAAHADHEHRHGSQTDGTHHALATGSVPGFMAPADFTKLGLVEEGATAPQTLGGGPSVLALTGAAGSLSTVSRQDHTHTHNVFTDPTLHAPANGTTAGFMTSSDFTKLASSVTSATSTPVETTIAPQPLHATAGSAGSAIGASADTHVHPHGAQTTATHHAAVTASVAGFMTAAQYTKLEGISPGAPAEALPTLATGAPPAITATGDAGVLTTAARENHIHAHGDLTDPSLHAVATASVPGFVPSALQAKLDALVYAVAGQGVANAGKVILLDATGKIASEYAGDGSRGTIDNPTQDIINLAVAPTQPVTYSGTGGGKIYIKNINSINKLQFAPANDQSVRPIQQFLGTTKSQYLGFMLPTATQYNFRCGAGVSAGSNDIVSNEIIRERSCYNIVAGYTASTYSTAAFTASSMAVRRSNGFYIIFTYNEGGAGKLCWVNAINGMAFIGLSPQYDYTTSPGVFNNTPNRLGFGLVRYTTAGNTDTTRERRVTSSDATGSPPSSWRALTTHIPTNTDIMELHIFCTPFDTTKVYWQIKNTTVNVSEEGIITGSLPAVNSLLTPGMYYQNYANATVLSSMNLLSIYTEQPVYM